MRFALGYAITVGEMFGLFNVKNIKLSTEECIKITGDNKRKLAERVFKYAFKLVIDDIINNSIIFKLPIGRYKAVIRMDRIKDKEFAKGRRNGKWQDVDILASDFSGYLLILEHITCNKTRKKSIYVDPDRRNLITEYTNNEKQYF